MVENFQWSKLQSQCNLSGHKIHKFPPYCIQAYEKLLKNLESFNDWSSSGSTKLSVLTFAHCGNSERLLRIGQLVARTGEVFQNSPNVRLYRVQLTFVKNEFLRHKKAQARNVVKTNFSQKGLTKSSDDRDKVKIIRTRNTKAPIKCVQIFPVSAWMLNIDRRQETIFLIWKQFYFRRWKI